MEHHSERVTREHLIHQLEGGQAFIKIEDLLEEVEFEDLGKRPAGLPYSFYEQFFHLRVAQYDILDFSRNSHYERMTWPHDYWPMEQSPASEEEWEELKKQFFDERNEMMNFILNPKNDLQAEIPHGDGQTLLREALLVLEHNAYHTGQLAIIFRLLNKE
ncbi:MAG: DinB family protein [Gracilimonas sp.]|uniref:DinB family protein n=1 Tax=Gracilimonas sp. TaxID=1974203 RepID=UPI001B2EDAE4|nr:DinB family protein [Gracilimonas sp.]MBO6586791.1 DinB family protein [Gracilimonas sp.]MBO6615448.1 DinB family protein [Gracilimonas sp.]